MTNHTKAQNTATDYPICFADIGNVRISDDFWLPKIKLIQNSTIAFALQKCQDEGRMENFLIAGKQKAGTTRGQMPFDDTDLYKIIEGASTTLLSRPNPELEAELDQLISIIKLGQEPDGYLTTWFTIDRKNPPALWVKPSEERWENEVSSHELYNSGHLFEAAATHYQATGKTTFLEIALKNADLLVAHFGPDKIRIPPGHQIVETGLIRLYRITENRQYLQLAQFFLDARGDSQTHELYGAVSQDHLPVLQQTEAVGHAVRAVYMYAAMTDIAALNQNTDYYQAVMQLWQNTVAKKMYLTGAIGSRHSGEAFGENYELPNLTAYGETCASIGNVHWNQRLFQLTGQAKYIDIIERSLYNALLAGISLDGQHFFYPNPLESDGEYKFNHDVACTRSPWFDCSCCPTNLIRFIPSLPGLLYAQQANTLYINLFASSTATFQLASTSLTVIQKTNYPWQARLDISVQPAHEASFTIKIRVPGWAQNQVLPSDLYRYQEALAGDIALTVNNQLFSAPSQDGYLVIERKWCFGDSISLELPMALRRVVAHPEVLDNQGKVAFEYGPLVYCAEECDNANVAALHIPKSLEFSLQPMSILGNTVNAFKGLAAPEALTLIPYYIWSNRGAGKMKVWFPEAP